MENKENLNLMIVKEYNAHKLGEMLLILATISVAQWDLQHSFVLDY